METFAQRMGCWAVLFALPTSPFNVTSFITATQGYIFLCKGRASPVSPSTTHKGLFRDKKSGSLPLFPSVVIKKWYSKFFLGNSLKLAISCASATCKLKATHVSDDR